jgi:hypothetical protein
MSCFLFILCKGKGCNTEEAQNLVIPFNNRNIMDPNKNDT